MKHVLTGTMAPGALLGGLAFVVLMVSSIFLFHLRRDSNAAIMGRSRLLPGLTVTTSGSGLVVTSVQSGSQAEYSGIMVGDDIVTINGKTVHSMDEAAGHKVKGQNRQIVLELLHRGRKNDVTLDRTGD